MRTVSTITGFLDKSNYTYYIALHSYFLTELISDVDDECLKLCIPVDYTANAKFDFCFIGKNDDYELTTKHIALWKQRRFNINASFTIM